MAEQLDFTKVKDTLATNVMAQEKLSANEELAEEHRNQASIKTNATHLKTFDIQQEGESDEEFAAEQKALEEAITATVKAHEAEGVTPELIRTVIHGEDIQESLLALHQRGIKTFKEFENDEDAVNWLIEMGETLGYDLSKATPGKYDAVVEEFFADWQYKMSLAGFEFGDFENRFVEENEWEAGRDGLDGKIGMFSMNIIMNAAKCVAPDDVVEEAIAKEATAPERRAAAEAGRITAFEAIGRNESGESKTGEINEQDLDNYGDNLAQGYLGVNYNGEKDLFTHELIEEREHELKLSEVLGGSKYSEIDLGKAREKLETFNQEKVEAFVGKDKYKSEVKVEGSQFVKGDRKIPVDSVLAAPKPIKKFDDWFGGEAVPGSIEPEGEEAPEKEGAVDEEAFSRETLERTLPNIPGVKRVMGEEGKVVLFDGLKVDLTKEALGYKGTIHAEDNYPLLSATIQEQAQQYASNQNLELKSVYGEADQLYFVEEGTNQALFSVAELSQGTISDDFEAKTLDDGDELADNRGSILAEHFAALPSEAAE